ncbi:hypothetical protein ElyMa_006971400 [Elysia marginata]|uniref:Uncharacterized protein n=1 Tax=Elysia marginata TaxID=1093978 RepID=A0AAV4JKG2_9GAST|nr:hypothetical protein ElyMa_006971400 [Elysia marginata]
MSQFAGHKAIRNALDTESLDDRRVKHTLHAADHEEIKAHIERYHLCAHHYRREHTPLRRYLPSDVSIANTHKIWRCGLYRACKLLTALLKSWFLGAVSR